MSKRDQDQPKKMISDDKGIQKGSKGQQPQKTQHWPKVVPPPLPKKGN